MITDIYISTQIFVYEFMFHFVHNANVVKRGDEGGEEEEGEKNRRIVTFIKDVLQYIQNI